MWNKGFCHFSKNYKSGQVPDFLFFLDQIPWLQHCFVSAVTNDRLGLIELNLVQLGPILCSLKETSSLLDSGLMSV